MLRTAMAILGNESDARDATQEALAAIWRTIPGLRDTARFDAWAGRILVNACRLQLRRGERLRLRETPLGDDATLPFRVRGGRASTRIEEAVAATDLLDRAFDRLEPDERALLVFHHLEGRSVAELATILEIPEGTVKSRLHAARFALERALDRERR